MIGAPDADFNRLLLSMSDIGDGGGMMVLDPMGLMGQRLSRSSFGWRGRMKLAEWVLRGVRA